MKLSSLSNIKKQLLFNELRLNVTHHSNALEGISLTFAETCRLLEYGKTADNKPLHEQLIILGFAEAFDFVVREASIEKSQLSSDFIKDIHALMFNKALQTSPQMIERPIGAWRGDERRIRGVDIKLSHPATIAQDIENLLYRTPTKMELNDIASFHINFERIHPFSDGNGRVGRLLITFQAIKNDFIPPLIEVTQRSQYLQALNSVDDLTSFLSNSIEKSQKLIKSENWKVELSNSKNKIKI